MSFDLFYYQNDVAVTSILLLILLVSYVLCAGHRRIDSLGFYGSGKHYVSAKRSAAKGDHFARIFVHNTAIDTIIRVPITFGVDMTKTSE